MTVGQWIAARSSSAPESLRAKLTEILGDDAQAASERTSELCIAAATRALEALVSGARFSRDYAIDLLAIDALTTFAFEHASESLKTDDALDRFAERSARVIAQLTSQRA